MPLSGHSPLSQPCQTPELCSASHPQPSVSFRLLFCTYRDLQQNEPACSIAHCGQVSGSHLYRLRPHHTPSLPNPQGQQQLRKGSLCHTWYCSKGLFPASFCWRMKLPTQQKQGPVIAQAGELQNNRLDSRRSAAAVNSVLPRLHLPATAQTKPIFP